MPPEQDMKEVLFMILIPAMNFLYGTQADTCGDKFLVVGRGIRYDRAYSAAHPASILMYLNKAEESKDLAYVLKKSGHKILTVSDEKSLFTNLESAKYDLVLLTLADVAALETKVTSTPSKPIVLPVVYYKSGNQPKTTTGNSCLLKYDGKIKNAIAVIDQVMEEKKKGKPIACKS
jgi:hypothetical protein